MPLGPVERLYPDSPPPATSSSGQYTMGSRFTVDVDGVISHLRFYHQGGCLALGRGLEHRLSLWSDVPGSTALASVADSPPLGHIGWRELELDEPVVVVAGQVVRVSYSVDNQQYGYTVELPPPDLAPSLTVDPSGGYYAAGVDVYPTNPTNLYHAFADVVFRSGVDDGGPSIAPGRRGDIVAALATVPGLSPSPTAPAIVTAGAAWPAWASSTWVTTGYWRGLWYVFVALPPGDEASAIDVGDPLVDLVGQALAAAGFGGLVAEPWSWALDANRSQTVPTLRFTAID